MNRTSIVIVAYGQRAVTERCLESLDACLGDQLGRSFELVLVDNDSPDDTLELFEQWSGRAKVVPLGENRNFAGGCNAGARAAAGDVLIFLNNDTIVAPGALEALAEEARRPGVGAVGPRLLYPDGSIQHAGVAMISAGGAPVPHHLFHHAGGELPGARAVFDLDVVTGACLAIRRELFAALDGFDEEYVNGWEDVDLCLRIRVRGERVVYRGDIAFVHDEGRTRAATKREEPNAEIFYSRWIALLDDDHELAAGVFGGRLPELHEVRLVDDSPAGARLVVQGEVRTVSPDGAEGRALATALEAAGLEPAVRDRPTAFVMATDTDDERHLLTMANARPLRPGALRVHVPGAGAPTPPAGTFEVLRLAALPNGPVPHAEQYWVAAPAVAAALIARGVPADSIAWLPPIVSDVPATADGTGILALLPAYDAAAARAVLESLAAFDQPVRVLPSVRSAGIDVLVAELAPDAELLPPCSSESAYAELAAAAAVVVSADPSDSFDRRALVAAATGAAPVGRADGPAAAVLGDELSVGPDWRAAIERAMRRANGRAQRSRLVTERCHPMQLVNLAQAALAADLARVA